jgi:hypothetical protein
MTTADSTNTTSIAFNVEALRYCILAAEADINALIAARTDPDAIQRTEASDRGLISKQDRYRRRVRQRVRRLRSHNDRHIPPHRPEQHSRHRPRRPVYRARHRRRLG